MFEDRSFHILTDYKPLTSAFTKKPDQMSLRQARHLSFISQFSTDIRHVARNENTVADTLSRVDGITAPISIDTKELAREQKSDHQLQHLLRTLSTSLKLREFSLTGSNDTIYCDVSNGAIQSFIPESPRKRLFDLAHHMSHFSVRTTRRTIADKFVWSAMNQDVTRYVKTCLAC